MGHKSKKSVKAKEKPVAKVPTKAPAKAAKLLAGASTGISKTKPAASATSKTKPAAAAMAKPAAAAKAKPGATKAKPAKAKAAKKKSGASAKSQQASFKTRKNQDALHAILENCDNETMEQFGVFLTKGNEHAYALNVLAWIRKMLDKLTEFPAGSEDVLRSEIEILLEDEAVSLKNMNAANPDGTLLHNIKNFVNDESKDAATFARSLKSHKKNAAMMFAAFCVQVLKESRDYAGEFNFLEEEEEAAVEEVEADLEEEDW